MTLEHLAASRGTSRLIDVEPTNLVKSLDSLQPIMRKTTTTTTTTPVYINTTFLNTAKLTSSALSQHKNSMSPQPLITTEMVIKALYSLLLHLIITSIRFARALKVYYLTVFYFIHELLITHGVYRDCHCEVDDVRFQLPKHVCVVLNDQSIDETCLTSLCTKLVDLLVLYDRGRAQMDTLTFYRCDPVPSAVKETTLFNFESRYNRVDSNNNSSKHSNDDSSLFQSDFLQDLTSNSIINRHGKTKESKVERKTKLKINFLSVEQGGKSILVNACKNIAAKVKTELLRSSDIEQQLVDNHVLEFSDMTEPHMLLSIGDEDTVAGFSPWHIRLSEIIKIPSYHLVNRFTVKDAILKYNKIEKRFGK